MQDLQKTGGEGAFLPSRICHASLATRLKFFSFILLRTLFALTKNSTLLFSIVSTLFTQKHPGVGHSLRPRVHPRTVETRVSIRYLITSLFSLPLGEHCVPLATLFHPWDANASANTFLPISTGAKRLRAPSASHRIPLSRSLGTTNTAGSKLVRGMVK